MKDLYHLSLLPFKRKLKLDVSDFPLSIEYTFYWRVRPLDSTNQTFMIKMLEDGLVSNGILPNDTPSFVSATTSRSILDKTIKEDFIVVGFYKKAAGQ